MQTELAKNHFFYGDVYSAKWLVDSAKRGELLNKDEFFLYKNTEKGIKRIEFGVNKPIYTITEALKIFELAINNK